MLSTILFLLYQNYKHITVIGTYLKSDIGRIGIIVDLNLSTLKGIKTEELKYKDEMIIKMSAELQTLYGVASGKFHDEFHEGIHSLYGDGSEVLENYYKEPTSENLDASIREMENLQNKLKLLSEEWEQKSGYRVGLGLKQ